jgi:hypothetical protein
MSRLARPPRNALDLAATVTQAARDLLLSDPSTPEVAAFVHALNRAAGLVAVAVATSEHTPAEYEQVRAAKDAGWLAGVEAGAKTLGAKP